MAAQTPTVPAARRAFVSQVAHDSDRDERVRIANYKEGPSPTSHGRATAKSTTSSNLLKKAGSDFPFGGHTEQGTEQGTNELMFKERNKNNERTSFPHLWKKERNKEHPC